MKIMVVGGSGQVGTYVVQELIEGQHEVTVFDRVPSSVPNIRWVRGATTDFGDVVTSLQGADAVIHLAAYPIPYKEISNHTLFSNNVVSTYNVFEAAAFVGIKRVVTASSSAISGWTYGNQPLLPRYLPIDEDHPLNPHDPYGLGKLCDESIARSFSLRCGMETVNLRLGWVLFPQMAGWLIKSGGSRITRVELFAYVDPRDVATAFRRAVEAPLEGQTTLLIAADDSSANEPLSTGLARVAPEIAEIAKAIVGDRPGVSNERAKLVLGWEPRHSWRRPD